LRRRNEEIATLKEELQEQCRISLQLQREARRAAAELADARQAAAAAEAGRTALELKLDGLERAEEEHNRQRLHSLKQKRSTPLFTL
jgi:hypothetical protein